MPSNNKQKLELTWVGKNNPEYDIANIEPRILEENLKLSNCKNDPNTENMLIHGDNLLALKALLPDYAGKVKCIYIDPPYNTGSMGFPYDDNVEHSTWLSLMSSRIELLRILLKDNGVILIHLDDSELHYMKVVMDQIFGRDNYINSIVIESSTPSGTKLAHKDKTILKTKDTILVYKKNNNIVIKPQYIPSNNLTNFNFFFDIIDEEKGKYKIRSFREVLIENGIISKKENLNSISLGTNKKLEEFCIKNKKNIFRKQPSMPDDIKAQTKQQPDKIIKYTDDRGKNYYAMNGYRFAFLDSSIREIDGQEKVTQLLCDIWTDISFHGTQYEGDNSFPAGKKPEKLLMRIFNMFTEKNDLVLDSFLGSGTTCAVAHKMDRKYIGIEMGQHAYTHCKIRLDKVIDLTGQNGISMSVGWKGGGAYKFYELAPSFIVKDEFGNPVIDNYYNDSKLIKAMCKLMNFTFQPSQTEYWKHGVGQGKNYLYVTTQLLTSGMVQQIASHLRDGESLIISPKKYEPGADKIDSRIMIKKIPQSVLKACHYGKKEYLLPIKEAAMKEIETEDDDE